MNRMHPDARSNASWLVLKAGIALGAACAGVLSGCAGDVASYGEPADGMMSFDEYVASLPYNAEIGAYIVEEDLLAFDEEQLHAFYDAAMHENALTLEQTTNLVDVKYDSVRKMDLDYCVSDEFDTMFATRYKAAVVAAMNTATANWESATRVGAGAATIDFVHNPNEDDACNPTNGAVFFYVRPSSTLGKPAASFMPNDTDPVKRQLFLSESGLRGFVNRTLAGLLRHELGHILGFRHEHMRSPSQICLDDDRSFRGISPYDRVSVMHYRGLTTPLCSNDGSTDYTLTPYDSAGVRCIYNPAADACKGVKISDVATQFTVDNNGVVYRWSSANTEVWKYMPPSAGAAPEWSRHSSVTGTSALRAGGPVVYRLTTAGALERSAANLNAWTALGTSGSAIVVSYDNGNVYRLNSNGSVSRNVFNGTSATWSTITAAGVSTSAIYPGTNSVFRRDADNSIYQWSSGTNWTRLGTGRSSVVQDRGNAIYALSTASEVHRYDSGTWTRLDTGVTRIYGGLETLYAARTAAPTTVRRYSKASGTWSSFALNVSQFFGGGGMRQLVRTNGQGGTVNGELWDYLYAQ